jgi:hypothetical protein
LFLHLQNFAALVAYKRFLSLCCRAARIVTSSTDVLADHLSAGLTVSAVNRFFTSFIRDVRIQLSALPDDFFTVDLEGTGLEQYLIDELTQLASSIAGVSVSAPTGSRQEEYGRLVELTTKRFGWSLPSLAEAADANARAEADEDEEEGEYAPAFVEM